jgi:hypothetical protein
VVGRSGGDGEGLGHGGRGEPVAVLGEAGHVEDRLVKRQAREPAQQEVVLELFDEAPFGGDRVEDLHELRPQQVLGSDRGSAATGVEGVQGGAHLGERRVDHGADRAQRVIGRHAVLEAAQHDEPRLLLFVAGR